MCGVLASEGFILGLFAASQQVSFIFYSAKSLA